MLPDDDDGEAMKRLASEADVDDTSPAKQAKNSARTASESLPAQFTAISSNSDDSFESLLRNFANLRFSTSSPPASSECPVCQQHISFQNFGEHVFQCTAKFDKEEQIKADERYAMELLQQDVNDMPELPRCPAGAKCKEVHFFPVIFFLVSLL